MAAVTHAVLLARLVEELLPDHMEEAVQRCASALAGNFDVEAARARLRELRPLSEPDADIELEALAGAFPMVRRAEVVKLEPGVPYAMIISSDDQLCDATFDRLVQWWQEVKAKLGWDLQILALEGKAMRVSFVRQDEPPLQEPPPSKPEIN